MDIEKLSRELERSGKAEKLRAVADTPEGRRLSNMIDPAAVTKAAQSGDTEAMRDILKQVLSTNEGQSLARMLGEAMK